MNNKTNRTGIIQELTGIAPQVATIGPANPYMVSTGYFASFGEVILERIRIEKLLSDASAPVYDVPDGYFDQLPDDIRLRIQTNNGIKVELDEIAPFLSTISKEQTYQLPEEYFAKADFARHTRTLQPQVTIVSMRIARKWMQYAAAAVMAGILITGAFLFTDSPANIEDAAYQPLDLSSELDKVSETELVKYLDNPEHASAAPATTQLASEEELKDVTTHLQQLSDEELKQYVTENAEVYEAVISVKEES